MEYLLNSDERRMLEEVRQFIKEEATPELREEAHRLEFIFGGEEARKFFKKFGAKGWLCPCWPKEYGGLEASEMFMYAVRNEMAYEGLPYHFAGAHMVGPSILRIGSEKHKKKFLPKLAGGEMEICVGYSEPSAGSDLVSLEMQAVDKGDHFLVNGQKTFNTHAHVSEYHWLAVRTDPAAPKHKGISLLLVDLKSPGITIGPLISMANTRTNEVYYDNVKVPKENLVGELNCGFKYIMSALDFERMFPYGNYQKFFENLVDYVKTETRNGKPLSKDPLVRQKIAELASELEVIKHLYYRLAHILDQGEIPNYQTSMEKIVLCTFEQKLANAALDIIGPLGQLKHGSKHEVLDGMAEWQYRFTVVETIVAGTNEIQRNIMAQRGLGLPRG